MGLRDPKQAPKCYAQIAEALQNQQGDQFPNITAKNLYSSSNSESPRVQCTGTIREPQAQFWCGFIIGEVGVRDF